MRQVRQKERAEKKRTYDGTSEREESERGTESERE